MKSKIIVIVGPTAAGKSALALELAKRLDGEIVSCDSMQIYKHMNIGTAKPTANELAVVRHHMIDIVEPDIAEPYSCADFAGAARVAINSIIERGKLPVLCGGTGLYIDSIIKQTDFSDMDNDPAYREELFRLAESKGNQFVHDMLREIDPDSAEAIHPNNVKRVIRALEIFKFTGKTKTEWDAASHINDSPYDPVIIGITYLDRELLYKRIDARVDIMIRDGLIDEASYLYKNNILRPDSTAAQAIGYKELFAYFDGETDLESAIENIKRETRRYAKRQMTWFKRNTNIKWLYPDEVSSSNDGTTFEIIVNNAIDHLKTHGFVI